MKVWQKVLIVVVAAAVGFGAGSFLRKARRDKIGLDAQRNLLDTVLVKESEPSEESKTTQTEELKPQISFKVPFTSQAPFGVWDADHEDFCEEASVVMAGFYKSGKTLDSQTADNEMQKLKQWQVANIGEWKSTNAQDSLKIASANYGIKGNVIYDFTIKDLKKALSDGHLVLLPAAGRKLGNPYFKQPGPVYHMLVVRGYDSQYIYTNDPGTRHGENYKYYPEIILNAAADWPGSEQAILDAKTRRAMIVID